MISTVISSGYSGTEEAALSAAFYQGLRPICYSPFNRRTDAARVPFWYMGYESPMRGYIWRMEAIAQRANLGLIFCEIKPEQSHKTLLSFLETEGCPVLVCDLDAYDIPGATTVVSKWLIEQMQIASPNYSTEYPDSFSLAVSGPREKNRLGTQEQVFKIMNQAIMEVNTCVYPDWVKRRIPKFPRSMYRETRGQAHLPPWMREDRRY